MIASLSAGVSNYLGANVAGDYNKRVIYSEWIGFLLMWVLFHLFKRFRHGKGYLSKEDSSYYKKDYAGRIKKKWSAIFVPLQRTVIELL